MSFTSESTREMGTEKGVGAEAGVTMNAPEMTFPDGGVRAWMVALGAGCVLFSTFGYVNAFGFVFSDRFICACWKNTYGV